jgi:hypothetical protein
MNALAVFIEHCDFGYLTIADCFERGDSRLQNARWACHAD